MKATIHISAAVCRLVAGKLMDRETGMTEGHPDDVYWKILKAGGSETAGCDIEIDPDDAQELAAEMEWALDGERDINIGQRRAAMTLLRRVATIFNSTAYPQN